MRCVTPASMKAGTSSLTASDDQRVATLGHRDAEALFRTKPILEIRNVEAATRKQIQDKKEELRQLVGNRYRDLIDSADSIVQMKSSCQSISDHVSSIHHSIRSLSLSQSQPQGQSQSHNQVQSATRFGTYGIACRVKYLVDTPENIWGCLDEFMILEAASRYVRAKHVYHRLFLEHSTENFTSDGDNRILSSFPVLHHQWQIVESFRSQISQRSRERLLDTGLVIKAYADALAAVAVIDELEPKQVFGLFLDTRKSWIVHKLTSCATTAGNGCSPVVSVICEVLSIIQVSVGQVGELFLQVLNDMPLFHKVISGSPPASQLFGGIPNPDEEVRLWKLFRDKLDSVMGMLDKKYIADTCFTWLRECGQQIVSKVGGMYLIDEIASGRELAFAEKLIRETMESKQAMEGNIEWLRTVFGSEIELPWNRVRELVLEDNFDLWDEIFEDAFVRRMKVIIDQGFDDLTKSVKVLDSIHAIGDAPSEQCDFEGSLGRTFTSGGVWFLETNARKTGLPYVFNVHQDNDIWSCLNAYFGPEISRIRDLVDRSCQSILLDLLSFLESQKASERLKNLGPYLQNKCYESISSILMTLKNELDNLYAEVEKYNGNVLPTVKIERSLFIGRLLFAFQNHSRHIPLILGSPRFWINETPSVLEKLPSMRQSRVGTSSPDNDNLGWKIPVYGQGKTSFSAAALLGSGEGVSPKLEELTKTVKDLSITAYGLWISWLTDELSINLSHDLRQDDALSLSTPWRGWEDVIVKQEQPEEGLSELNISLPSMPSLYVISFLFRASEEVHRIGGHVLDKKTIQNLAFRLLEKVIGIYEDFLSTTESGELPVSEKGIIQVLFDVRFAADILSGSDPVLVEELQGNLKGKFSARKKQSNWTSSTRERADRLLNRLSQKLDPIDWLTYEPYLWENEKQSYLRHAVLFGFFVQLNRMYKDTVQKLPANSESNIMRCCTVPRFKYLPISAPTLSSRGNTRKFMPFDDISSRNLWNSFTSGEISQKINMDDQSSLGIAAPFLKSFMQVGSRFGESTLKLGSILSDGQVGMFKDRSAAAMSTFGDILPAQAAGLLSSFATSRSES